jgi:DNA invertase Pin-like site-specific DNA recombinase
VDSGLSIENQKRTIQAECDRRGWSVFSWFVCGMSARSKNGKAPPCTVDLDQARALARGQIADGIMATKLDRLSRYTPLTRELFQEASHPREGYALVALDNAHVDSSTAAGRLQLGMMALFAEYEGDVISERTKAALAIKRSQGIKLGRPRVISSEIEAELKSIAAADGMSVRKVTAEANRRQVGGRTWGASTVHMILSR